MVLLMLESRLSSKDAGRLDSLLGSSSTLTSRHLEAIIKGKEHLSGRIADGGIGGARGMRVLLPESGNARLRVCSQGTETAPCLMQNMIQSSLLQLHTVNFPAGFCARSLCRTTCSSRFIFCRGTFQKR